MTAPMIDQVTGVPLLDLQRVSDEDKAAFRASFDRVLESGCFVLGPEVEAFEQACAEYIGVRHALGVSSGTDALLLALMALDIGPGDEVICPTFTFFATAGTVWRLGAKPVFVDVHPCCYNPDPAAIAAKITDRTRAIMPVHLYGQCADMGAIEALAADRGIPVVEDAAQAIRSSCGAGRAGAMGTLGCISFYPTKNLSGFGDGGLVTTDDSDLYRRLSSLRVHGWGPKYHHKQVGGNFRMDSIQGALLRHRLPRLDEVSRRRRDNAAHYTRALTEAGVGAVLPSVCEGRGGTVDSGGMLGLPAQCSTGHTFNQFTIRVPDHIGRDALREELTAASIGTEIYYPICLHEQECFVELGGGEFPIAQAAARSCLSLPIFPELTAAELDYVVDAVVAACRSRGS